MGADAVLDHANSDVVDVPIYVVDDDPASRESLGAFLQARQLDVTLCESGDVFTRDAREFLEPRELPKLERGDLLVFHDAGAYGVQMSSYYNSLGRAPQRAGRDPRSEWLRPSRAR